MKWYKELVRDRYREGELVPWWKGFICKNYIKAELIVAPIPFNFLYGLLLEIYYILRMCRIDSLTFYRNQLRLKCRCKYCGNDYTREHPLTDFERNR